MTTTSQFDIASRALLSELSISVWLGRKFDRAVSDEVASQKNADMAAGRYNKRLIEPKAFSALNGVVARARNAHYKLTLPWKTEGERIMPVAIFDEYAETMRKLREEFEGHVRDFIATYPERVEEARRSLGDMYDPEDYPSQKALWSKFRWTINYGQVDTGSDWRVSLPREQVAKLEEIATERAAALLQKSTEECMKRLAEVVSQMAEKLRRFDPESRDGRFKNSMVEHVREAVRILPALNLTGNELLAGTIAEVEAHLTVDPDTLRTDGTIRRATLEKADAIMANLSGFMGADLDLDDEEDAA